MLQFLKATKKETLPESLKPLCPATVKWQSFQFLQVIFKNLFGDTLQLLKYRQFVFFNVHNMLQRLRSNGKFKIHKYLLYNKQPAECAILSFLVFSFLQ